MGGVHVNRVVSVGESEEVSASLLEDLPCADNAGVLDVDTVDEFYKVHGRNPVHSTCLFMDYTNVLPGESVNADGTVEWDVLLPYVKCVTVASAPQMRD